MSVIYSMVAIVKGRNRFRLVYFLRSLGSWCILQRKQVVRPELYTRAQGPLEPKLPPSRSPLALIAPALAREGFAAQTSGGLMRIIP